MKKIAILVARIRAYFSKPRQTDLSRLSPAERLELYKSASRYPERLS